MYLLSPYSVDKCRPLYASTFARTSVNPFKTQIKITHICVMVSSISTVHIPYDEDSLVYTRSQNTPDPAKKPIDKKITFNDKSTANGSSTSFTSTLTRRSFIA